MSEEGKQDKTLPGARLRAERERRGFTLAQMSAELHADQRLLGALEADDYETLGAPIFVKGHLRNYARLLGLDAAELIAAYEAAQQPSDPTLTAYRSEGARMDERRSGAWVGWFGWLFLLVLALMLAGWWYYQQEGGANLLGETAERIAVPEERRVAPTSEDIGEQPSDPSPLAETLPTTEAEQGAPEGAPTAANETTSAAQTGEMTAALPQESIVQAPAAREPAPTPRQGLVLEFSQESWVEIYDAEGRPILYDLIAAGARREINASGRLRVFLGNADAVTVYVGGERFDLERHRRSDSTARFTVNVPAN